MKIHAYLLLKPILCIFYLQYICISVTGPFVCPNTILSRNLTSTLAPNFVQIYPKKFSSSSSSPYNSGSALAPALGGGRLGASPVFTGSVAGVWRGSLAPSLGTAIAVVTGTLVDVVVADAPADASLDRGALPPPLYAPAFVDFFAGEAAATADASTSPPISGSICDLPANSTLWGRTEDAGEVSRLYGYGA